MNAQAPIRALHCSVVPFGFYFIEKASNVRLFEVMEILSCYYVFIILGDSERYLL